MYHLAKSIYLYATSKEEYSILLLGLDNAGKTTLLSSIKSLYLPEQPATATKTVPTVGQNVSTISMADMYLKIWDVGGQHSLRKLWQSYYKSCHAIVFVIDSSDLGDADLSAAAPPQQAQAQQQQQQRPRQRDSHPALSPITEAAWDDDNAGTAAAAAAAAESTLGRLEECKLVLESVLASADTTGVPILILANKQDREDCVETVRIKEGLVRPVFEGAKGSSVRDSRVLPISALTDTGVREAVEWLRSRVTWNKEARPPEMR